MNRQEFLDRMDEYGFDLDQLDITVGEPVARDGAHGVYERDGQWYAYCVDGQGRIVPEPMDSEAAAFDALLESVNVDLRRFTNKHVTREIAKLPKEAICGFLRKEYALSSQQADEAWDELKRDMNVLFELKYYIAAGRFVPVMAACQVQGYTAERLHDEARLSPLAAFRYLIFLGENPREALDRLAAGRK